MLANTSWKRDSGYFKSIESVTICCRLKKKITVTHFLLWPYGLALSAQYDIDRDE